MVGEDRITILPWICLLLTLVNGTFYPSNVCSSCLKVNLTDSHKSEINCSSQDLSSQCGSEILKRCPGLSEQFWVKYYDITDLCYSLHKTATSWYKAKDKCEEVGGRLLKMEHTELEQLGTARYWFYKGSLFWNLLHRRVWIGGTNSGSEKFSWTDGTPLVLKYFNRLDAIGSFFKDFFSRRVLCITLNAPKWEVEECNENFPFICEHATVPVAKESKPVKRKQNAFRKIRENFYVSGSTTVDVEAPTVSLCLRLCKDKCDGFNYHGETRRCRGFGDFREGAGEIAGEYRDGWEVYEQIEI